MCVYVSAGAEAPGRARARGPAGSVPVYERRGPGGEAQKGQRRPAGRKRTEPAGWKEKGLGEGPEGAGPEGAGGEEEERE